MLRARPRGQSLAILLPGRRHGTLWVGKLSEADEINAIAQTACAWDAVAVAVLEKRKSLGWVPQEVNQLRWAVGALFVVRDGRRWALHCCSDERCCPAEGYAIKGLGLTVARPGQRPLPRPPITSCEGDLTWWTGSYDL